MTGPFEDEAARSETDGGEMPGPYDDIGRELAGVPCPRPVRMSRRGKSTAGLVAAILLVSMSMFVAGLSTQSKAADGNPGSAQFVKFALPIGLILAMVPFLLLTILRQKKLIAEGDLAIARVTERRLARHGPTIRYEFKTPSGEHLDGGASDGTGQLSAGMSVPVFYNPRNPKRQLALCASFFEVVTLGER